MKRLLIFAGTRPEAIKLAPVILEARRRASSFETTFCVTAQHRELLDDALGAFGIRPDMDLDLMVPDQSLDALTARVLGGAGEVIAHSRPDVVIVQGDTTTAMASAVAAFHAGVPVAHVEAGVRSHDVDDPWPEEANRRLITQLATWHFAPTESAAEHLAREGVSAERVVVTGNTSIDAARLVEPRPSGLPEGAVIVTCHRRENLADDFAAAAAVVEAVAESQPSRRFVLPLHPNPRVREPLRRRLAGRQNLEFVAPLSYPQMLDALARCAGLVTDSGGLQEEATWFGKPCLVLRRTTDRPEAVAAGVAFETELQPRRAVAAFERFADWAPPQSTRTIYGEGRAASRILEFLRAAE